MNWVCDLQRAIDYMEEHLLEDIHAKDVAGAVHLSAFYLQRSFSLLTGYTIGEYIRGRRLYMAALDLLPGREKVIEVALRYGYETPESFARAFTRFHGVSPLQIRGDSKKVRPFLPLHIRISIQGGKTMDVRIEHEPQMQLIGWAREFSSEDSYQTIPRFWDEFSVQYKNPLTDGKTPQSDQEKAVCRYRIGEFGVCLDSIQEEKAETGVFQYWIAGRYDGGPVPQGMQVCTLPEGDWAKFRCTGPMPGAMQSVNTRIFQEWLPTLPQGESGLCLAGQYNLEWYSQGNLQAADYESAIWIPVKKK